MSIGVLLRNVMHELNAAYECACEEYGEDSDRAQMLSDAIIFMRGWMRRYSGSHGKYSETPGARAKELHPPHA